MSLLGDTATLILATATLVTSAATAYVTIGQLRPKAQDTHAKVTELANGARARTDQLEQTLQTAGVAIPPAPLHPGETGSEPT